MCGVLGWLQGRRGRRAHVGVVVAHQLSQRLGCGQRHFWAVTGEQPSQPDDRAVALPGQLAAHGLTQLERQRRRLDGRGRRVRVARQEQLAFHPVRRPGRRLMRCGRADLVVNIAVQLLDADPPVAVTVGLPRLQPIDDRPGEQRRLPGIQGQLVALVSVLHCV